MTACEAAKAVFSRTSDPVSCPALQQPVADDLRLSNGIPVN
jgi:hypothetical protein